MPGTAKPKRVAVPCTLPEALATQLRFEADSRLLNPSLLVERAVAAYLPTLPQLEPDGS